MTGNVVFLCDYQAPYGGNFIASLRALECALLARDIRAVYLLPGGARSRAWCQTLIERGATVAFFDPDGGKCAQAKQIIFCCRRYGAKALYVHFGKYAVSALAALMLPKLRLVWHYHSDFSAGRGDSAVRRAKRAIANVLVRLLGRRVTRVAVAEHIAAKLPGCTVLQNAVAPERLIPCHAERDETRRALGYDAEALLVLLFGWSPYIKGVDLAVNAVSQLNERGERVTLLLVGGREYSQQRMQEWIASHTACSGNEAFVRYLPPTEDVFAYHEAVDAMLSASRSEANPYSLLEAVSSLRPCAVTDIPGTRYLSSVPSVFFAPPEDAAALADAISRAVSFSRDSQSMPALLRAQEQIKTKYAIDPWIDRVVELLGF